MAAAVSSENLNPNGGRYIHPQSLAANKPINDQENDGNNKDKNNSVRRIHFPLGYRGILLTPQPAQPVVSKTDDDSADGSDDLDSDEVQHVTAQVEAVQVSEIVPPVYRKVNSDTIAHINNGSLHHTHTQLSHTHTAPPHASDAEQTYSPSYHKNTVYETQLLEYISDYRLQYITLFPARKPLLLTCLNECHVTKSVCTYIKPVLLPHTGIHDIASTARLVSDMITYKPLSIPIELPVQINTSSTCVSQQSANSLEQSILLASILIGLNYNVYVVSGYATQAVCNNDQSHTQCSDLLSTAEQQASQPADFGSYTKLLQPNFNSKFHHNQSVLTQLGAIQLQNQADQAERQKLLDDRFVADPYEGKRIHCWVLVLPDATHVKADVSEPMFVEPSTGKIIPVGEAQSYVGVESLFNNTSYFINMKNNLPAHLISYTLADGKLWECMLGQAEHRAIVKLDESDKQAKSPTNSATALQHNVHAIQWVKPVMIDKKLYEYRYPSETKQTRYYACDCYQYNKYSQPDSAICRYVVYVTDKLGFETKTIKYVKTTYYNRKDKLIESTENMAGELSKLYTFERGLTSGLHTYKSSATAETYAFYENTRIDRLSRRVCKKSATKKKQDKAGTTSITEHYNNRSDRLQQRTLQITYDTSQHQLHTIQLNYSNVCSITILSITELYERSAEQIPDASFDIASVAYDLARNTVEIKSHHINTQLNELIASKTTADKAVQLKHLKHAIKEHELAVYDIQTTMESIMSTPATTTVAVVKTMNETIDDMLAFGINDDSKNTSSDAPVHIDYLKPFTDKYVPAGVSVWTNAQKQSIREAALSVYKQTLLDRSNIINDHIDSLKQQLQSSTQLYKRNANSSVNQGEISELQFQLSVLTDRKAQYEQAVLKKYIAFDQKLSSDSRLQIT